MTTGTKATIFTPRTLADWLARVPGGSYREQRYGMFGPGSGLLMKDITTSPPADAFVASNFFVNTFGAKVWDALNNQTRAFNLIRKVAWGPTTGWRIRSERQTNTRPVTEVGALPDIDSPELKTVYLQPKFIVTPGGVSALAQFLGTLEGGIGDALAVAQEFAMLDHTKRINQMLVGKPWSRITGASGSTITVVDAQGFSAGDTIGFINDTNGADIAGTRVVQSVDYATNQITLDSAPPSGVSAGDFAMVLVYAGIHSLDTAVANDDARDVGGVQPAAGRTPYGSIPRGGRNGSDPAEFWAAGTVLDNGGVLRHLSTQLLDQAIDSVRRAGGEPDLILTQVEQITRLGTILQANQHFIGEGTFQVKLGGEGTLRGYPTGFQVATYKGIPLFHDFDVARSEQQAANGNSTRGGHVYVLDTRFLEIPVLWTTQYMESRDYLQNNMLGIKFIFVTAMELRCLDFRKQAKIVDLSDGTNLT
jgi:hypothetical protein